MKILYLAHRLPYPPNKGDKIRSFHQPEYLSRRHRVWCACFVYDPADLNNPIGSVDVAEDGSFTIRGLPDSFILGFVYDNGGVVVEVLSEPFEGVKPNQEIDIVVAMEADGSVTVVEETRTGIDHEGSAGIELNGMANVLTGSQVTGSLEVNTYTVLTRAGETSIRKGQESMTLDDIDGKQVHVRGVFEPEGSNIVFAFEIKLQEEVEPANEDKVMLCHIPPGNPGNAKTITVGASAVAAHLAHGDTLGPCP